LLQFTGTGNMTFENIRFQNNEAERIIISDAKGIITAPNIQFLSNQVNGLVDLTSGDFKFSNVKVSHSTPSLGTCFILKGDAKLFLSNSNITGCSSTNGVGVLKVGDSSEVSLINVNIADSKGTLGSVAMFSDLSQVISKTIFLFLS